MKNYHLLLTSLTSLVLLGCGLGGSSSSTDSTSYLVTQKTISSNSECTNGGLSISTGPDNNGNGALDSDEIDITEYLCHGEAGIDGVSGNDGQPGPAGQPGANGNAGVNGINSLIKISLEPAGLNCQYGGKKADVGLDTNSNAELDESELIDSVYLCNEQGNTFAGMVFMGEKTIPQVQEIFSVSADGSQLRRIIAPYSENGDLREFVESPDGTKILYSVDHGYGAGSELYVASLVENTAPIKVSRPEHNIIVQYKWASDSARLAFLAKSESEDQLQLYTVNADGTLSVKVSGSLIEGGNVHDFSWSPDGLLLVYRADQEADEIAELYTVEPNGLNLKKVSGVLVANGSVETKYSWSSNSKYIAFIADKDTANISELYVSLHDGSLVEKVSTETITGRVYSFKWAPDSLHIAYRARFSPGVDELFTVEPNGNSHKKISGTISPGFEVKQNGYAWAFDSSLLAYTIYTTNFSNGGELFTVKPNGSDNVRVSIPLKPNGDLVQFAWSPNSLKLAYTAIQETENMHELFTVNADGTNNTKISGQLVSGGNVGFGISWSPTGTKLLYRADQETDDVMELFAVDADGSNHIKVSKSLPLGYQIEPAYQWSPDESRIAYFADSPGDGVSLYTVKPNGEENINVSGLPVKNGAIWCYSWQYYVCFD